MSLDQKSTTRIWDRQTDKSIMGHSASSHTKARSTTRRNIESSTLRIKKAWRGSAPPWSAPEAYLTLDNGGYAFRVRLHGDAAKVSIDGVINEDSDDPDEDDFELEFEDDLVTVEPQRVFVGCSPLNRMTSFSGGHGPDFLGNSVLLEFPGSSHRPNYMHVGSQVVSFRPEDRIEWFVSPVGNSGVPYPYCVDVHGRVYLLIESVVMTPVHDSKFSVEILRDPYDYYYDKHLMTPDRGVVRDSGDSQEVEEFEGITGYMIGDTEYTLTYHPNAAADYDSTLLRFDENGRKLMRSSTTRKSTRGTTTKTKTKKKPTLFLLQRGSQEKVPLTKESYVDIMRRFGESRGFSPIPDLEVLFERS